MDGTKARATRPREKKGDEVIFFLSRPLRTALTSAAPTGRTVRKVFFGEGGHGDWPVKTAVCVPTKAIAPCVTQTEAAWRFLPQIVSRRSLAALRDGNFFARRRVRDGRFR